MIEARDFVYYGPGPGGGMVTVSANDRREDERREEENGIEGSMAGDEDEDEISGDSKDGHDCMQSPCVSE